LSEENCHFQIWKLLENTEKTFELKLSNRFSALEKLEDEDIDIRNKILTEIL